MTDYFDFNKHVSILFWLLLSVCQIWQYFASNEYKNTKPLLMAGYNWLDVWLYVWGGDVLFHV